MISVDNGKGFSKNECWVIVNDNNCVVDYTTFKNNRRKSYFYSRTDSVPNTESQFKTEADAIKALAKCKRRGTVKKMAFEDADVSSCYDGEGARVLGYDFVNEKIWIESLDRSKYGYDYRTVCIIN